MWQGFTVRRTRRLGKTPTRRCRFGVEQLENRLAPAVFHVNTFLDTPPVNLYTGQDAAGHISLRSAVASANAHPQNDTILLDSGVYQVQGSPLAVQSNLKIIGKGPDQTMLETRHLDRLFETDGGNLQLDGLTLNGGSAATLLKGTIDLSNIHISDVEIAAVAHALLADKEAAPIPQIPVNSQPANNPDVPEFNLTQVTTISMVGPVGGGGTAQDPSQDQETHQAFWRFDVYATPEQPALDAPEEMKQNNAPEKDTVSELSDTSVEFELV